MQIVMIGGGICGLGAALMLARDGHDVTVLEKDEDGGPDSSADAWESWTRDGVAQFRQPHNLMPGARRLLGAELPDVHDALPRAGATIFDFANPLPPSLSDQSRRPVDAELWTYTGRRPMLEWVFADAARNQRRLTIRRGARVAGLIEGARTAANVPHVAGVRTTDGETLHADLVVDATGRQSKSPEWLQSIGAQRPHEEGADSGFAYYTRYFHGTPPERRAGVLTPIGTISILTLPGDHGTWSVTIFTAAGDQPLKSLRHVETWNRTMRACPLHAHWIDGDPLTDILPMAGIVDRYRRFVVDDVPVVTGFAAIADAWACTNPSAGRGLTVGFLHAVELRDALREAADDPRDLVTRFDARTEERIAPWYRAQMAVDHARFAEMEALRAGHERPPVTDELARSILSLFSVMGADPDLFRAALEYVATITPVQDIVQRPEVIERIRAARARLKDAPPPRPLGPDRQQLLDLLRA